LLACGAPSLAKVATIRDAQLEDNLKIQLPKVGAIHGLLSRIFPFTKVYLEVVHFL
jgi:hypothetical protein